MSNILVVMITAVLIAALAAIITVLLLAFIAAPSFWSGFALVLIILLTLIGVLK